MNLLGLFPIVVGVVYLVYSFLFRNKVTIYNRNKKMNIIREEGFLKLQLFFSIINSLFMIILGLITIRYNLSDMYVIASPLFFHLINYLLKLVSKMKGYVRYN